MWRAKPLSVKFEVCISNLTFCSLQVTFISSCETVFWLLTLVCLGRSCLWTQRDLPTRIPEIPQPHLSSCQQRQGPLPFIHTLYSTFSNPTRVISFSSFSFGTFSFPVFFISTILLCSFSFYSSQMFVARQPWTLCSYTKEGVWTEWFLRSLPPLVGVRV